MSQQAAVKAVIYDDRGRVLLQKRDNIAGILEPGRWGFFGGMVEEGESLESALARELLEELSCEVGTIETELFRSDRGTYGILIVAFLVRCTDPEENFHLTEGQAFGWFTLDELVFLPLSALVFRDISRLLRVMASIDKGIEGRLEQALLDHARLSKKNDRVFYAKEMPAVLDMQSIMLMKELAAYRGLPTFRVCLHEADDEQIHEMLMIHTQPQLVGPLKQNKTSLSYHMLDGAADIWLHDDTGAKTWTRHVDSNDDISARCVRLDANVFRSMQTLSPYSIFLEVASGHFKDSDTIWLNTSRAHS